MFLNPILTIFLSEYFLQKLKEKNKKQTLTNDKESVTCNPNDLASTTGSMFVENKLFNA